MKRLAVVGFGFMGLTHSLSILRNKDLKLAAIVDADLSVIEKNLDGNGGNLSTGTIDPGELEGIHKYSNLDDCLRSEDLDAVIICVHVNLHYEMAKKVLLYEKDVFVEKPFCLDTIQAEELISLADQKKKVLMVGHVVRFMPPYQKIKHWIDSKEFGNLRFLSLSRFCGLPGWGQWKEKNVRELSGGALFDLAIHDIDFDTLIAKRCFMFGTSGSVRNDMIIVLDKTNNNMLNTDISVDAISGIAGAIDGITAVENRTQ